MQDALEEALAAARSALLQGSMPLRAQAQLKAALPRLLRDCSAVLCGLRPGFMLDYAQLAPDRLAAAVSAIECCLQQLLPGPCRPCVATLEGCCYVVRPELLLGGPRALAASPPSLIAFSAGGAGLAVPRWAEGEEAAAAVAQLASAASQLRAAAAAADAAGRRSLPVPVVRLEDVKGAPLMPTLSGFLLGYPAVYLVQSREGAQAAARALSAASLRLHSLDCELQGLEQSRATGPLLSFSVPEELLRGEEGAGREAWQAALRRWQAAAAAARERGGLPWLPLRTEQVLQQPRPVAL